MTEDTATIAVDLWNDFLRAVKDADYRDLQNEMAGLETGRLERFLTQEQREERKAQRSGKSRSQETLSRLQLLLASNPAYAKLYNDTMDKLREAERLIERAIEQARKQLERAEAKFQDTLENAARLPNGTRVFRDDQGQVWTEHGQRVGETESQSIVWRDDAPSYQEFLERREAAEDSLTTLEGLQGAQIDLGDIRNRMEDDIDPPGEGELHRIRERLQTQIDNLSTTPDISADTEPANQQPQAKGIQVRSL